VHHQSRQHNAARAEAVPLNRDTCRRVFIDMVRQDMDGGVLRYGRRQKLVRFARTLGIEDIEAHRMIAEVQHGVDVDAPGPDHGVAQFLNSNYEEHSHIRGVMAVVAGALLLDAWLITWLFF
jgi:hypothetical protein